MDTSKTYGVLGKFVLRWILMPVVIRQKGAFTSVYY